MKSMDDESPTAVGGLVTSMSGSLLAAVVNNKDFKAVRAELKSTRKTLANTDADKRGLWLCNSL